ncbi:MAG: TetR/AcrR family transcriptional regulator [Nitriliruptor sp.]|nr:MAG: TetR/AcrR family transcriptional regulator [Nitriliruptor sp.]
MRSRARPRNRAPPHRCLAHGRRTPPLTRQEQPMGTSSTKDRLVEAALRVVAREGISGTSARVIAAEAGVNQALVFYHHSSVEALLAEASRQVSARRAARYAQRLATVTSFTELSTIARQLHDEEHHSGDLAVLTQLLAGARTRPAITAALRDNFELLVEPVEQTLARLVMGTALEEVLAVPELARSIAGGFLGLELLDGVVTDIDAGPFDAIDAIAGVVDLALQAGVIETAVLRRRLRSARS